MLGFYPVSGAPVSGVLNRSLPAGKQSFASSIAPVPLAQAYFGAINLQLFTPQQPAAPIKPIDWRGPDITVKPHQIRWRPPTLNINLFPPPIPLPEGKQSFSNPLPAKPYIGFDSIPKLQPVAILPTGLQSFGTVSARSPYISFSYNSLLQTTLSIELQLLLASRQTMATAISSKPYQGLDQENLILNTLAIRLPIGAQSFAPPIKPTTPQDIRDLSSSFNINLYPVIPQGQQSYSSSIPSSSASFWWQTNLTLTLMGDGVASLPPGQSAIRSTTPFIIPSAFLSQNLLTTTLSVSVVPDFIDYHDGYKKPEKTTDELFAERHRKEKKALSDIIDRRMRGLPPLADEILPVIAQFEEHKPAFTYPLANLRDTVLEYHNAQQRAADDEIAFVLAMLD